MFLLAAVFALRRACSDGRFSSAMELRGTALLRALISSFWSTVKLSRRDLSRSRLARLSLLDPALLRALIPSLCSAVKLSRRALSRSRLALFLSVLPIDCL